MEWRRCRSCRSCIELHRHYAYVTCYDCKDIVHFSTAKSENCSGISTEEKNILDAGSQSLFFYCDGCKVKVQATSERIREANAERKASGLPRDPRWDRAES